MPITLNSGVQGLQVKNVEIKAGDMVAGAQNAIELPPGAIVTGGRVTVLTAFNVATTINVGDALNATRLGSAFNLSAVGVGVINGQPYEYPANNRFIQVTPSVITATTGRAFISITFIVPRRTEANVG